MPEFLNWPIIGAGAERTCYRDPSDSLRCIKVSKKTQAKQTQRELKYYQFLAKHQVSYSHIPKFYRKVDEGDYIGLEMEYVCNPNGESAPDLHKYLKRPLTDEEIDAFYLALEQLKQYLITNNVVPCDLVMSNFLVLTLPEGIKIMMVDVLGGAEVIPFANYIPYFGRRKIERKWIKFMVERIKPTIEQHRVND